MALTDAKERERIMREARENIAWGKQIQRDHAECLQRIPLPDPLIAYRAQADAAQAAEKAETRRRLAATQRDQRERERERAMVEADIDTRIAAAIAHEREFLCDLVGSAIGELLAPLKTKCDELERLLNRLQSLSAAERAQPVDLPSLRELRRVN
jgi:hypothetical protein